MQWQIDSTRELPKPVVIKEQAYSIDYFAQRHGISLERAESIIKATGGNRDKSDAYAELFR
jgi:hypothetical protein